MSGLRGGLKRLAARGIATGHEIAMPVFDGTDAARWRVRDAGTLRLVALRAGLRLGTWERAERLIVVLGRDADNVAAFLNSHPQGRVVPSFDLLALRRAALAPARLAALIRLHARAFRDTGGRWDGRRMGTAPAGDERAVLCLGIGWPHGLPEDAGDLLADLARAIAPRRLGIVQAGEGGGDLRARVADGDWLDLSPAALSGDAGARGALLDFAGLDRGAMPGDAEPPSEISVARVHVMSCLSVAHDLALLPHFLDHYTGLGVVPGNIHVILNARDADAPELYRAREILVARGIAPGTPWIGPYSSTEMWERRRALHRAHTGPGDWAISADVDELHVYPEGLAATLWALRHHEADWLQGPMIDRVAPGGRLAPVEADLPLWDQFPIEGDLMCQISRRSELKDGGGTVKAMLMASHLLPGLGGHGVIRAECAARANEMATAAGIDIEHPRSALERSLHRAWKWQPGPLWGSNIGGHPRITDPVFRLSFPAYVAHFKWRDVLVEELARRRASGLQTEAATRYSTQLQDFLKDRGTIDLGRMAIRRAWHRPRDWAAQLDHLRAEARRRDAPEGRYPRALWQWPRAEPGWRVRQLSFGSASGIGHFHSYYDIPVLDAAETRIAAVRTDIPQRPPDPGDRVTVGTVGLDGTGFTEIAETHAWSWQQGPMLQWLPGDEDRLIWNDREGADFVARIASSDGGNARRLDRPIYALSPDGQAGLSLDFARLDALRPGYGYAGGRADLDDPAPEGDGIWRVDLETGAARLILPLARAREALMAILGAEERAEHQGAGYVYWFNHCKVAPGGGRFTVKLRWRRPGGGWNGTMGVSVTCGMDGTDPRVIARATSHVIWLDDRQLYFWNQGAGYVALKDDAEASWPRETEIFDRGIFTANVHLRHIPDDPARMVFDTPYAEDVGLNLFDRETGEVAPIARWGGHVPAKGQFRCDLHPVPTRDGGRIVVSSPADGMRQIYVAERT